MSTAMARITFAVALFVALALGLCACDPLTLQDPSCDAVCGADFGANRTAVDVAPTSIDVRRGDTVTAVVTVVNASGHAAFAGSTESYGYGFRSLTRAEPDEPGVQTRIALVDSRPCRTGEVPARILDRGAPESEYFCTQLSLTVTTLGSAVAAVRINLTATFRMVGTNSANGQITPVEFTRGGQFEVRFAEPGFDLAVVPLAKVYATRGFVAVQLTRRFGFSGDVTLRLEAPPGSGIGGNFIPSAVLPAGSTAVQLQLLLPAQMGGGWVGDLKVLASGGGIDRSVTFTQRVEPLYTVTVATADGSPAVLTPNRPLDLQVTVAFDPFGPFSLIGPGRIELSLPDPPPGVSYSFLPDAQPVSFSPAVLVLRRTLRLSGPRDASMDDLRVRATAAQLTPDESAVPQQPYAEGRLPLRLEPALTWDFVDAGAAYFLSNNDSVGIGMQRNDQPAIAWLEGLASGADKSVYLKRFDGATFVPSPSPGGLGTGLAPAVGSIEQARMVMAPTAVAVASASNDDAHVAFTYKLNAQEGARVGYGLNRVGAGWTSNDEVQSLPLAQHARSPRIAAGPNGVLALSYLVETGIPAGAGALFVRSRLAAGTLAALTGPQADGSINVSTSGQVLRDTPALALRADGNPWLAWIEERFAPVQPLTPALWLRGHDGTRWGAPVSVPTRRPLVAAPTQLLVAPNGTLVVAWLESSPARLMLATVDPATGVTTELRDGSSADGALNLSSAEPARDIALALDPRGRVVVTWTEGLTRPLLYVKRRSANAAWDLLGTSVDALRPTRSPFVISDGNGRLFVVWTGYFGFTDLSSPNPRTDVLVGRWIFTEDF